MPTRLINAVEAMLELTASGYSFTESLAQTTDEYALTLEEVFFVARMVEDTQLSMELEAQG